MSQRKLRIMMVAPTPYFADCGRHVRIYEQARALMRCGHLVQIASYPAGRDMPGVPVWRSSIPPWLRGGYSVPSWHGIYLHQLLYLRSLTLARVFRPHLIHAHLHGGAWIGARLKKRLGIPLLFDFQKSMTGEMIDHDLVREGSFLQRLCLRLERRIDQGPADFIVTRSSPLAEELVRNWGVPRERVASLPDGVDTSLFRPYRRDEVRAALRLPPNVPLVVYLGSFDRNQGIETLLTAIVQLQAKGSPLRFLLMGSPEQEYRRRAEDLGIERMIVFTGVIEYSRAPLYLSAGDMAVSPTCRPLECNSKLLGFMACGLPTVAFDTPVNREIMGDAGVYARYDDDADLAAKLTWLERNGDQRLRLGHLARERALGCHSWDIRGKALDELYRHKLRR